MRARTRLAGSIKGNHQSFRQQCRRSPRHVRQILGIEDGRGIDRGNRCGRLGRCLRLGPVGFDSHRGGLLDRLRRLDFWFFDRRPLWRCHPGRVRSQRHCLADSDQRALYLQPQRLRHTHNDSQARLTTVRNAGSGHDRGGHRRAARVRAQCIERRLHLANVTRIDLGDPSPSTVE